MSARVERSVLRLSIPLKEPFVTANGVVSARELLLLRLEARDGMVGYGEAAPFEPYDGVPLERAEAALTGGGGRRPPQVRAAEEIARLDLHARQEDRPLAEPRRHALPVNMTLAAGPPDEVAERARAGMSEGYACFKLKVGLPDDAERVAAVREAIGPWPALRVDANGAWSVDEAVHAIRSIEEHDLELVEQPCGSLRELAEVRQRVSTPIAADESVASLRDLRRAVELEACDVVNVKLASAGGFKPARELLREARSSGLGAFLSSTLDGPWGIAAALQLAAAEELTLACGLATLGLFDSPVAAALPPPRGGTLEVPGRPGPRGERRRRRPRGRHRWSAESEKLGERRGRPRPGAAGAAHVRHPPRSPPCRSARSRRCASPRGCSRRRARRQSPAAAARAARSSCQTGSSTPWPAVRKSSASERGSWDSRPGRWASTSASDWSANSGWRSQSQTMSSIGIASIQEASFSSASARATRSGPSSMPAVAPTVTTAL